jgi:hypothetical protein
MGHPNRTYQCYELPPHMAVPCTLVGTGTWAASILTDFNLKYQVIQSCFAKT